MAKSTKLSISQVMEESFLRYSMSVIVARALPDVRDGLKPVHRRILFTMHKNGIKSGGKTVKSARIVGDVMGKYHPHGDTAIYDAMARLVVPWSTRYPLVTGQGNFGSMDGDPPAADRYTEAKLSRPAEALLEDLDKETVDFRANYDGTEKEPEVLPAKLPNLLLNGQIGIAVGMATNIPPHNLSEVIDASVHLIENPESSCQDLLKFIKGPDFPTGGIVYGGEGMQAAYASGRGGIVLRGRAEIVERKPGAHQIVITQIPYAVSMSSLVEKIADLVRDKKITAISDIRDETARGQVKIVIDLKKDAYPKKVLNQLYKHTPLQTSFHYNMLALIDGIQPRVLGLVDILSEHLKHRQTIVRRRTEYELKKAKERQHILEGLTIALDQIDAVIETIRASQTTDEARANLIKKFKLSILQANAILAMQLRSLAGLERQKVEDELTEINKLVKKLTAILASKEKIRAIVRDELLELKDKYGDERCSEIVNQNLEKLDDEDLIPNEQVIVTLTTGDYIKRSPVGDYKKQGRGGKGRKGMSTKEDDIIQQLIYASTHDNLLFFTNQGRVFQLKCYKVPATANLNSKGIAAVNVLSLSPNETISAVFRLDREVDEGSHLFMCTKAGVVKKTLLEKYRNVRSNGIITIRLDEGDALQWVRLTNGDNEVVISTAQGQANRFHEKDVRPMGRTARGVRGIRLRPDDFVVGMDVIDPDKKFLVLSEQGYGKLTKVDQFTLRRRGTLGIRSAVVNEKTGKLITVRGLSGENQEIIVISAMGQVIRVKLADIPTLSRATQGVRVMRLNKGDQATSVVVVDPKLTLDDEEE